jgi:hypothetical protein
MLVENLKDHNTELKLTIFASIFLILFKLIYYKRYDFIFVNWFAETFVLLSIFLVLIWIPKFFNKKFKISFYVIHFVTIIMFVVTSIFIYQSYVAKYNLVKLSLPVFYHFVLKLMPISAYVKIVVSLAVIALTMFLFKKFKFKILNKHFLCLFALFLILTGFFVVVKPDYITNVYFSPFLYSDAYTKVSLKSGVEINNAEISQGFENYDGKIGDYNYFIMIMEGVGFEEFTNYTSNSTRYFNAMKENSFEFTNYHTPNLDSKNSLVLMLLSEFIPFESYIFPYSNYHEFIKFDPSLVEYLNLKNYSTIGALALTFPTYTFRALPFDSIVKIENFSVNDPDFSCQKSNRNEDWCEDRYVLGGVKEEILKAEGKWFVFQEMILGHNFKDNVYVSPLPYYEDYIEDVVSFLNESNELDSTIIVVVSDHGHKWRRQHDKNCFEIPLMFYNPSFNKKVNDDLYSHLSFKDLLFAISLNQSLPIPEEELFLVGHTLSNEVGYYNENFFFNGILKGNNYYLFKNYSNNSLVKDKMVFFRQLQENALVKSKESKKV